MVTKVLRVKAKAPRLRFPVSLGERAWIDPIVIGRSGPGDHCQITLERWLPRTHDPPRRPKSPHRMQMSATVNGQMTMLPRDPFNDAGDLRTRLVTS